MYSVTPTVNTQFVLMIQHPNSLFYIINHYYYIFSIFYISVSWFQVLIYSLVTLITPQYYRALPMAWHYKLIRLNEPFKWPKLQPDWSTNLCFIADFAKYAKRKRKKRRKKIQSLAARISEMAEAIFFKFGMWTPLASQHYCSNFGFNWIRNHGATKV